MNFQYLDPFIETVGREALREIQLKKTAADAGPGIEKQQLLSI